MNSGRVSAILILGPRFPCGSRAKGKGTFLEQVQGQLEHYRLRRLAIEQESPARRAQTGRKMLETYERFRMDIVQMPASARAEFLGPARVSEITDADLKRIQFEVEKVERQIVRHAPEKMIHSLLELARTLRIIAISFGSAQPKHWLRKVLTVAGFKFGDRLWRDFVKELDRAPTDNKGA